MECIAKGCENHDHEGDFIGDLCAPCYEHLKEEHEALFIWAKQMPDLKSCDIDDIISWMAERPFLQY